MNRPGFGIQNFIAIKQDAAGVVDKQMLCPEARSPKVGLLSTRARMVIEATRRCLAQTGADRGGDGVIGMSIGTLCGADDVVERCLRTAHEAGIAEVSASWYATGLPNSTAGVVASLADLPGPNLTLLGYQAGLDAIIMACRVLRAGGAQRMLAGGFDLPGNGEIARLTEALSPGCAKTMRAGVGLLMLTNQDDDTAHAARIVGWSYGDADDAEDNAMIASALGACGCADPHWPLVRHRLAPGQGGIEYLAAGGPIRLVDVLSTSAEHGLHAFIGRGRGLRPTCLVVAIDGRPGTADGAAH